VPEFRKIERQRLCPRRAKSLTIPIRASNVRTLEEDRMSQRTTIMLASMALLGLAMPQSGLAQTNVVPSGIFQLNIAKSKFPGAPVKSQTVYFDGHKATAVGIDAQGNARTAIFEDVFVEDGKSHPVKGFPLYDAITYTRVDAYTVSYTATKDGKVARTGTWVTSADGKTFTNNITNPANGQQVVQVYDKQ
jgi:hypothetical protein